MLHAIREVVIEVHGGDRRKQSRGGGDQRLRYTRRDDAKARRSLRADLLERIHDAPDRSEQTDERRDARGRGEECQAPFEFRHLDGGRTQQRAIDGIETLQGWTNGNGCWLGGLRVRRRAELRIQLRVSRLEQSDERTGGQRAADRLHFGKSAALAKNVQKRRGLTGSAAELQELVKDDPPRDRREQHEDREHEL